MHSVPWLDGVCYRCLGARSSDEELRRLFETPSVGEGLSDTRRAESQPVCAEGGLGLGRGKSAEFPSAPAVPEVASLKEPAASPSRVERKDEDLSVAEQLKRLQRLARRRSLRAPTSEAAGADKCKDFPQHQRQIPEFFKPRRLLAPPEASFLRSEGKEPPANSCVAEGVGVEPRGATPMTATTRKREKKKRASPCGGEGPSPKGRRGKTRRVGGSSRRKKSCFNPVEAWQRALRLWTAQDSSLQVGWRKEREEKREKKLFRGPLRSTCFALRVFSAGASFARHFS